MSTIQIVIGPLHIILLFQVFPLSFVVVCAFKCKGRACMLQEQWFVLVVSS